MDILYNREEQSRIRALGAIAKDGSRADFIVVQSDLFFGKAIVVNLLTGRAAVLGHDDFEEGEAWAKSLGIPLHEASAWQETLEQLLS